MLEESKEKLKSFEANYSEIFKAPTKSFQSICSELTTKVSEDAEYMNNLTMAGIEFSDTQVNQFFTSTEYLELVSLVNSYQQNKDLQMDLE